MRKEIQTQIDSTLQSIHELEIERAKLDSRLETLQEMLELAPEEGQPKKTRRRSLSPQWQGVLYLMTEHYPEGASYDEIHDITEQIGIGIKKANLRGHMGNYKASGYVKAVSPGVFVLTPDGMNQAKKSEINKSATEAADSNSLGADTGRGDGYPPDNPSGSIPDASTETSIFEGQQKVVSDLDDEIPF